ncbi:hypothetical protein J1605_000976 [Eschrichtius robustus]|uniref:Fibronectin type-III domain-containing protein n=1 Tax=Eschrichtius robustus TaxID=9764 RepID=A0AB34GLK5_ESCRO|nr:hypothetical protein J1605_000976 [Eschrichtius robustus]
MEEAGGRRDFGAEMRGSGASGARLAASTFPEGGAGRRVSARAASVPARPPACTPGNRCRVPGGFPRPSRHLPWVGLEEGPGPTLGHRRTGMTGARRWAPLLLCLLQSAPEGETEAQSNYGELAKKEGIGRPHLAPPQNVTLLSWNFSVYLTWLPGPGNPQNMTYFVAYQRWRGASGLVGW